MKDTNLTDTEKPDEAHSIWEEPWLAKILASANIGKMDHEQRAIFNMNIVKLRMARQQRQEEMAEAAAEAEKKGYQKGLKISHQEGFIEGVNLTFDVFKLFLQNKTADEIAQTLKTPVNEVKFITRKLSKLQMKPASLKGGCNLPTT